MTEVPVYSECVIGYRQWQVEDWVLAPVSIGDPWRPGVNHARCRTTGDAKPCDDPKCQMCAPYRGAAHTAPAENCECGLYALHTPPERYGGRYVIGAVAAWGDLRVHHAGFRAEYAQIVALADQDVGNAGDLREIAAFYGVPLVPLDMLTLEAERHGCALPESIRPEKPPLQPMAFWTNSGPHGQAYGNVFVNNTVTWSVTPTWQPHIPAPPPPKPRPQSRFERKQSNRQGPGGKRRGPKNIDPRGAR